MNKIILLVIVLVVLVGGYFLLFPQTQETALTPAEEAVLEAEEIEVISNVDTVKQIDQELEETAVEDLDKEFADIETEIEEALSDL